MCPTSETPVPPARKPDDLRSAFDVLDVDRDGKISHNDLKILYPDVGDDIISTMMTVADANNDGYIEYHEFENILLRTNNNYKFVMEDVFNSMDRDGDGKLGHDDIECYLKTAGIQVNGDDIKAMIRLGAAGDNNDGVTFEGFLKILAI